MLVRSIEHISHPSIDPAAVASIARTLPNNPRLIENAVLTRIVPYAYDWQTAGVPWYFPTTREALAQHRGDCESRAVVLASILAYKHIPYQLRMSFDHIWVDYPGHQATALENPGVQIAVREHGHFVFHWPKDFHLGAEVERPDRQLLDADAARPPGAAVRRLAGDRVRQRDRALASAGRSGRPAPDRAPPATAAGTERRLT